MNMKQTGHVFRKGDSWFLRYRDSFIENGQEVRKQVCKKLDPVAPEHARMKNPPQAVKDKAQEVLARINTWTPESNETLDLFTEKVYFPHAENEKRASTLHTDKNRWKNHLKPRCGHVRLREFRTVTGEQLIADIARKNDLSRATLWQLKSFLSAIFKHAKRLGYIDGENPMREVSIPKNVVRDGTTFEVVRGKAKTYAYSHHEIKTMLRVLPEPARTMAAVAGYAGLRRGEIQGLRWEDYDGVQFSIAQSIWEGQPDRPKSDASADLVPVVKTLSQIVDNFRMLHANPERGPMFRASNNEPLRLNNVLRSQILPVLRRCASCGKAEDFHGPLTQHEYQRDTSIPEWRGWHAFRRGLATNLHDLGVDDLTIQGILRHSDVSVTQQSYIKRLPKQAVSAMDRLEAKLSEPVVQ